MLRTPPTVGSAGFLRRPLRGDGGAEKERKKKEKSYLAKPSSVGPRAGLCCGPPTTTGKQNVDTRTKGRLGVLGRAPVPQWGQTCTEGNNNKKEKNVA
ncbi:hypothetical protein [Pandoravirus japonicus]|uniref:Uncharacterized protein n=1 Tax=Pandoravirus japonicus TaxID=2823154 RepID=A0A811BSJ9_9VIRU|nr:hypothetical protein [Pandoravirus japonicus]